MTALQGTMKTSHYSGPHAARGGSTRDKGATVCTGAHRPGWGPKSRVTLHSQPSQRALCTLSLRCCCSYGYYTVVSFTPTNRPPVPPGLPVPQSPTCRSAPSNCVEYKFVSVKSAPASFAERALARANLRVGVLRAGGGDEAERVNETTQVVHDSELRLCGFLTLRCGCWAKGH